MRGARAQRCATPDGALHPAKSRFTCCKKRREDQPARVIAIADKAMQRLNRRFARMAAKGIPPSKIAVARELAGFLVGSAVADP